MLGEPSADVNREDDVDDENEDGTGEPDAKRRNQSQTSDTDDREEEEEEEEEQLLSLNDGKGLVASNVSIGSQDDFEPNDLNDDDEFRLLDS